MKVAFVTDTHFGYAKFEQDAYEQGRAAILDACRKADALVLGGDIFDHRIPRLETLLQACQVLQEAEAILQKKGSAGAIFGIHGTHERRAKDVLNPFSLLSRMGLVQDVHNRTAVFEKKGEKIAISGLGGIPDDLVKEALGRLECGPE
jgi:DNA repair exonuclease SbcCD nuclease subunit